MRGVKKATAKGRTYYYHRATGERITAEFGTAEFLAKIEELDARLAPAPARYLPETLGALFDDFRNSQKWNDVLADRTKVEYAKVLDWMEPIAGMPLRRLSGLGVSQLQEKAYKAHGWWFANYVLTVLRLVLNWGKRHGHPNENPAEAVEKLDRPKSMPKKNRAWKPHELQAVLDAAKPIGLKAAVALGAYVGLREKDVVSITWAARQDGCIVCQQSKVQGADVEPVYVPEFSALTEVLDAAYKARTSTGIVTNTDGQPYTQDGFRASFFKLLGRLRADGKIGDGLTFHGLRTTAATVLADLGCDDRDIAAVTGHRSIAMVRKYTEGADRRRRAKGAILRMERNKKRTGNGKPD